MSLSSIRITIGTVKSIDFVRGLSIQGSVVVQSALNYKTRHNAVTLFELTLRTWDSEIQKTKYRLEQANYLT